MVHNHGAEDGPGLSCPEYRLRGGGIRGECLMSKFDSHLSTEDGLNVCDGKPYVHINPPEDTLLRLCKACFYKLRKREVDPKDFTFTVTDTPIKE